MSAYRRILWPLLAHTDPEWAHERAVKTLEWAQEDALGRRLLAAVAGRLPERPVEVFGLTFPNPLGVAAGFDKDARIAAGLAALGFGHVEVGTLTPRAQPGNPRPRLFRLPADRALVNRLGFPNRGATAAAARLAALPPPGKRGFVLGVSLGKQKETPLAAAAADYLAVMREVYPHADYLAVNVSSPNTPGLRRLQGSAYLSDLLAVLVGESRRLAAGLGIAARPVLVKIAPELSAAEIDAILEVVERHGVAGVIATNTTLAREGLTDVAGGESGGLSGHPLAAPSTRVIAHVARATGGRLPIIGVGGVFSAADMAAKLAAGASLVQLYTALVYEGPGVAGQILRRL